MITTYATAIVRALERLGKNGTTNPDEKSGNSASSPLGELFLWQEAKRYCETNHKAAMERAMAGKDKTTLDPGAHILAESANFVMNAEVTNPVKRFSEEKLIEIMTKSKYKISAAAAKQMILDAKVEGNPKVTIRVVERA